MYSKAGSNAGKHEYVLDLPSIGSPSYIVVRLHSPFELFGVGIFSDVACSSMSSPTFLQIRPNEVLHSLGGYPDIKVEPLASVGGNTTVHVNMVTLPPPLIELYSALRAREKQLAEAVVGARCHASSKSHKI